MGPIPLRFSNTKIHPVNDFEFMTEFSQDFHARHNAKGGGAGDAIGIKMGFGDLHSGHCRTRASDLTKHTEPAPTRGKNKRGTPKTALLNIIVITIREISANPPSRRSEETTNSNSV